MKTFTISIVIIMVVLGIGCNADRRISAYNDVKPVASNNSLPDAREFSQAEKLRKEKTSHLQNKWLMIQSGTPNEPDWKKEIEKKH